MDLISEQDLRELNQIWQEINKYHFRREVSMGHIPIGGKTGVHGGSNSYFEALMILLFRRLPTGKFLDLGFGSGIPLIHATRYGWDAYGIDLNPLCLQAANRLIAQAKAHGYIRDNPIHMAIGNFFPEDFTVETSEIPGEDVWRSELERLVLGTTTSSPYARLRITPSDIDLFYHYQTERTNNILRFFSAYAKPGAQLYFAASFSDTFRIPNNVQLIGSAAHQLYLYEKTNTT